MRRVAAKMLLKELVHVVTSMKVAHLDAQMKAEAEIKMRRVGAKMLMGEQLDCLDTWKTFWNQDRDKGRAERLMRRVGGRLMQRDLVSSLGAWRDSSRLSKERLAQEQRYNAKQRRVAAFFARQTMSLQEVIMNAFKRYPPSLPFLPRY